MKQGLSAFDFQKIGFWVKKNIKYDLNLSGHYQYFALDIYKMRRGVCHHFTVLSNALLYSLGYKVLDELYQSDLNVERYWVNQCIDKLKELNLFL